MTPWSTLQQVDQGVALLTKGTDMPSRRTPRPGGITPRPLIVYTDPDQPPATLTDPAAVDAWFRQQLGDCWSQQSTIRQQLMTRRYQILDLIALWSDAARKMVDLLPDRKTDDRFVELGTLRDNRQTHYAELMQQVDDLRVRYQQIECRRVALSTNLERFRMIHAD